MDDGSHAQTGKKLCHTDTVGALLGIMAVRERISPSLESGIGIGWGVGRGSRGRGRKAGEGAGNDM